jgi:ABC-type multidrug transport system ATPase subunit
MKPVRYGSWRRFTDAFQGWRDGRAGIPARIPGIPERGPVTTPHREALIRLAQDAFAQEHLDYQRLVSDAHRRIMARRVRLGAAGESLTWTQSVLELESQPLTREQLLRRRHGEAHHPDTVIVQRRQREQQKAVARARSAIVAARKEVAEVEAALADDMQEAEQQHRAATVRVQRIHEHIHRRLAVYRRSLIRAHPDGGWVNSVLSVQAPEIPGWALPDAYLPDGVPRPPAPLGGSEDDDDDIPDVAPPPTVIELRCLATRFGSIKPPDTGDVAFELLTDPRAAEWHFTVVKKARGLELQTRNYPLRPYIGGKPVESSALLEQGDSFDFAENRYTVAGPSTLHVAPIGKPNLVASDLYATTGSKVRLSHMSFVQEEQTLLAILGPSGAGKSSLFSALLGELPLESGELFFSGLPMATHSRQIRDQLGFVPQGIDLHMSLTVEATLRYGFGLRSPDRRKRDTAITDALKIVNLTDRKDQPLSTLSGGQLRRVSIALELLTSPPLLLLDEPTSGLDAHMDREIMTTLRRYAEEVKPEEPSKKRTVIVVTHATEHLAMAHQILVVVDDGAPAYSGPPRQIRKYFGFKSYADLMSMLMDRPREWAERYQANSTAAARREAEKLATRSASEVDTVARHLRVSRPRSPRDAFQQLGVLIGRQISLLASRGMTKKKQDRSLLDYAKNAAVVSLPLTVAALSAVLAAFVASTPGLGGLKPSSAGPTALTLLTTLCILSGQALTYSDVVNELKIIEREYRAGVRAFSVLIAKWLVYAVIAVAQAGVITFVFCVFPGRAPGRSLIIGPEVNLFFSLAALTVTAMTLGLLVSAVAAKLEHAVAMVTAISIAQIALNGITSNLSKGGVIAVIGEALPDRWGLAAAASSIDLRGVDGIRVSRDALWDHTTGQWLTDVAALAVLGVMYFALATCLLKSRLRVDKPPRRRGNAAKPAAGHGQPAGPADAGQSPTRQKLPI